MKYALKVTVCLFLVFQVNSVLRIITSSDIIKEMNAKIIQRWNLLIDIISEMDTSSPNGNSLPPLPPSPHICGLILARSSSKKSSPPKYHHHHYHPSHHHHHHHHDQGRKQRNTFEELGSTWKSSSPLVGSWGRARVWSVFFSSSVPKCLLLQYRGWSYRFHDIEYQLPYIWMSFSQQQCTKIIYATSALCQT